MNPYPLLTLNHLTVPVTLLAEIAKTTCDYSDDAKSVDYTYTRARRENIFVKITWKFSISFCNMICRAVYADIVHGK